MMLEGITPSSEAVCNVLGDVDAIERQYCSNFTCCSQMFADLHSLLDHRDRHGFVHVNDSFVPQTPASTSSEASSPPSPTSPMMPSTPIDSHYQWPNNDDMVCAPKTTFVVPSIYTEAPQSQGWPTLSNNFGLLEDLEIGEVPIYEQCFNTAVSSTPPSPAPTSALFSSSTSYFKSLPTSLPTPPSRSSTPFFEPRRARSLEFPSPAGSSLRVKKSKSTLSLKDDILKRQTPTKKVDGRSSGRRRERRYVCSTPGCTKSYLNPNGLKYHQEKGTCSIPSLDEDSSPSLDSPSTLLADPLQDSAPLPPSLSRRNDASSHNEANAPRVISTPSSLKPVVPYRYPDIPVVPPPTPSYYLPMAAFSSSTSSLSNWNGGIPL